MVLCKSGKGGKAEAAGGFLKKKKKRLFFSFSVIRIFGGPPGGVDGSFFVEKGGGLPTKASSRGREGLNANKR